MSRKSMTSLALALLLAGSSHTTRADETNSPEPPPLKADSVTRRHFEARDKNGDGKLSEEEFVQAAAVADRPQANRDFHLLDLDRDGVMSLEEFRNVNDLVPREERGRLPDPVAALVERHFKESQDAWDTADVDGDGRLGMNEFRAASAELLQVGSISFIVRANNWAVQRWANHWRLLDRDQNGFASRDEWRWFLEVWYGVRRPQGELLRTPSGIAVNWMHFKFLDRNQDDRVDHEEFVKFGFDGDMAEKRFAETDKNHDNSISFPEWADTDLWCIDLFALFRWLDTSLDARLDRQELLKNIPEWQQPVARHMFPGFDTNRDGFLSLEEFALTPLYRHLDFWHDRREDRDADGRLTFAEFQRDEGPSLLGLTIEYFRRLDADEDGALDHAEWQFHTPEAPQSRLYVMNADGSQVELLADLGLFDATFHGSPEWSHDGKTIVFDSTPAVGARCNFSRSVISAVAMSGPNKGKVEKLGYGNCPDWSPDDKQIAFFVNGGNPDGDQHGLWIMNVDGTNRRLIDPAKWYPRWSPDGRSILCCDTFPSPNVYFLLDVNTGESRQVLQKTKGLGLPAWDPGGNLLCLTLHLADRRSLCLVNLAGDPESVIELWKTEMTPEQAKNYADTSRPNWSADGLQIIYTDNTSGKCILKRVASTGEEAPVEVAPALTHLDVHAVWSPDGKRIAFTSTQPPAEIPGLKLPARKKLK